jgi:uncharacterized protein YcsI (UPF0317 family)
MGDAGAVLERVEIGRGGGGRVMNRNDASVLLESQRVRREIREGRITGTSRGLAHGFVQSNLAILPKQYAFDFLLYCQRNQRSCPVLEVTDPGSPEPKKFAPGADLRTDCARYAVYIDGVRVEDRTDIRDLWRDDLVTFLIGSGITIDGPLEKAGVPTHKDRWVLRTTLPTATQVTSRFPFNHGAPIHIGDPATIGADLKEPLFGGPVPPTPKDIVPVFWACGVTPQSAAENAKLPLFIAHAPAHSFITDMPSEAMMNP